MKLLPKSEVDRAKAVEKKQEIDEGLKIARKIDNLREIANETEANLNNFRRETIAKIHEEITIEAGKRDELKKEVRDLEDRRAAALKPLNEEKEKIEKARVELENREKGISEREEIVSGNERAIEVAIQEASNLIARGERAYELSKTRLRDADTAATAAELALEDAQKIKEQAIVFSKEQEEIITHREELVLTREKDATIREKALSEREEDYAARLTRLKDREAMVERDFARIHKYDSR